MFVREYLPEAVAPEVLDANQRTPLEQMASLRFATPGESAVPTVLGILVVGRDPIRALPCAYVQFVRYAGASVTDNIMNEKQISGPLPQLIRTLDEVCEAHVNTAVGVVGRTREERRPDYPLDAIRQLTRNAVLHRTYEGTNAPVRVSWFSDRIEIQNPGGPFGQVTKENFGKGTTDYRNPHLAEAMRNLGYVQRFGVGIPIAREMLKKNGNPDLEFVVEDTNVLALVRSAV
jgi:ATP-dependent DNA helicase RecG